MSSEGKVSRRDFIQTGATAGALLAAGQVLGAPAEGKALGANERIKVGVIGPGGRAQAHMRILTDWKREGKPVEIVAIADVFNKHREQAAQLCGVKPENVYADYRKLLDNKDIDAVLIATPDHWHAKQTIDAADAGKDVYCEKPMTHTIDEAHQVCEAIKRNKRVMTVGVQSTSSPIWDKAHEVITAGRIGKVMQAQTSYYRNSDVGQWRYYGLSEDMTPKNIDWDMFLGTQFGLAPKVPFDRAKYAQWRCYWDYGGGMYTDLFVHQLTHLIKAMGVRFPRRVVGGGGLYLEYDGRDVPDVATVVADYNEGSQVIVTATMCNDFAIEEVIRGHTATIRFNGQESFDILPQKLANKPGTPSRSMGGEQGEKVTGGLKPDRDADTKAHWENFFECMRKRQHETDNPPELGYAAIATVNLGVKSYREGKAFYWDQENHRETLADESWAKGWEKRSHERGKPVHVMGWHAGDTGSLLHPPAYQRLEGPWINGQPPKPGDQRRNGGQVTKT